MDSENFQSNQLPRARKRFGQHFLRDGATLDAIADALGDVRDTTVVEIGPGRGALTDRLVERTNKLVAIEIDRDLAAHLEQRYVDRTNVRIVTGDVLEHSLGDLAGAPFVLAGNVPYYITTPIIFHALQQPRPLVAVYLVQKEVAERLAAKPGEKSYGALGVNVQAFASVELIRNVPARAFQPPPKVESAVVRVIPRAEPVVSGELESTYRKIVQAAFGLRRKQLLRVVRTITAMSADQSLELINASDLDATVRPETLSPADFARLVTNIVKARRVSNKEP